jgi:hypothetical protein
MTMLLNKEKVIDTNNYLWIETMFSNIIKLGKDNTFEMIDSTYKNPITRIKVRKMYFDTLAIMEK